MKNKKAIKLSMMLMVLSGSGLINTHIANATLRGRISALLNVCRSCTGRGGRALNRNIVEQPNVVSGINQSTITGNIEQGAIGGDVNPENKIISNLTIRDNLKGKINDLISQNMTVGRDAENFDTGRMGILNLKHYYYQYKRGNEEINLASLGKPQVVDINDSGAIITRYYDSNGVEKHLVTRRAPIWVTGKDIHDNKMENFNDPSRNVGEYLQSMNGITPVNPYENP